MANWMERVNISRDISDCTGIFTQQKARAQLFLWSQNRLKGLILYFLVPALRFLPLLIPFSAHLWLLFLFTEKSVMPMPLNELRGLSLSVRAVGRLSQNSIFQNNKQDNSVYVFAFVNWEIHTVLAKGNRAGQLLHTCWLKGNCYHSCNIFFVLP